MSVVQSCMYLSLDRTDISFASKELPRWNECPNHGHLASLRRLAGYIKAHIRFVNVFEWKEMNITIEVFSDSDWAGCRETGKSTSGGIAAI